MIKLFDYHPYGRKFRILKYFGYWYCEECKKLHPPTAKKFYVRDNEQVC